MDNGNFGTQDILTGRGLGLAGFGGYNYGSFAGPSSNAVRINRNADLAAANERCTQGVIGAGLDRISAQNFEGRFNAAFESIRNGQFQAELRNGDRLRDIEREMAANARTAAECCCDTKIEMLKCCCDTQKLVTAEATATRELIIKQRLDQAVDTNNINATVGAINAAAAQNTAAIVNAINNTCGPQWPTYGCPDQIGDMVDLCYQGMNISVPQESVKSLLADGALCGTCEEQCCPGQTGPKVDMCLQGNDISVSQNACKGIKQAGGTCGPCPAPPPPPPPEPETEPESAE